MTLVGVTGALCAGKSTACAFFRELGARVIDADKIVHRLYKTDGEVGRLVKKNFGSGVLTKGKVDTVKLGKAAFAGKKNLEKLCRIVHPRVIKIMRKEVKRSRRPVTVLDAPLLIETGLSEEVDYVVVVSAPAKKRIKRCVGKRHTREDIRLREARQMCLRDKIRRADFVIYNNSSKQYVKKEAGRIWKTLKRR